MYSSCGQMLTTAQEASSFLHNMLSTYSLLAAILSLDSIDGLAGFNRRKLLDEGGSKTLHV